MKPGRELDALVAEIDRLKDGFDSAIKVYSESLNQLRTENEKLQTFYDTHVSEKLEWHPPSVPYDPEQSETILSLDRENDKLRERVARLREALTFCFYHGFLCGHDDPTWCEERCRAIRVAKQALAQDDAVGVDGS